MVLLPEATGSILARSKCAPCMAFTFTLYVKLPDKPIIWLPVAPPQATAAVDRGHAKRAIGLNIQRGDKVVAGDGNRIRVVGCVIAALVNRCSLSLLL